MSANLLDLSLGEIIEKNKGSFKLSGRRQLLTSKRGSKPKSNGIKGGGVAKNGRVTKQIALRKTALRGGRIGGNNLRQMPTASAPQIVDARLKIIEKTRSKIGDARDRLNQKLRQVDARSKIKSRASIGPAIKRQSAPNTPSRRPINSPRSLMPSRNEDSLRYGRSLSGSLAPGLSSRSNSRAMNSRGSAYMDREQTPEQETIDWTSRMQSLPRLEIHVPTLREREPLREPLLQHVYQQPAHRTHMDFEVDSWSRSMKTAIPQVTYRPRDDVKSRLEPARMPEGYRIVVSNLQPTVTHEDIKELFEDVGVLIGSRVVRPGTAEVVYKNLEDAVAAVDTYHNRQLDGQPMKCLLVKSSRSTKVGRDVLPDITTVHHALFTK